MTNFKWLTNFRRKKYCTILLSELVLASQLNVQAKPSTTNYKYKLFVILLLFFYKFKSHHWNAHHCTFCMLRFLGFSVCLRRQWRHRVCYFFIETKSFSWIFLLRGLSMGQDMEFLLSKENIEAAGQMGTVHAKCDPPMGMIDASPAKLLILQNITVEPCIKAKLFARHFVHLQTSPVCISNHFFSFSFHTIFLSFYFCCVVYKTVSLIPIAEHFTQKKKTMC